MVAAICERLSNQSKIVALTLVLECETLLQVK